MKTGMYRNRTLNWVQWKHRCIKRNILRRLIPFFKKYQSIDNVVVWPDLATIHYAKDVQKSLKSHDITCLSKGLNPPNVPHARPIQAFRALTKKTDTRIVRQKLYAKCGQRIVILWPIIVANSSWQRQGKSYKRSDGLGLLSLSTNKICLWYHLIFIYKIL